MGDLLAALGRAFSGSAPLAMGAALAWGVLSVLLSPCHLASIPLVVGYMGSGREIPSGRQALRISSAFAVGILASIAAIGVATALAGRMLGDVGRVGNYLLAAIFVLVGLNLAGALRLPASLASPVSSRRRGAVGALLLGLVFGVALGPCSFAFMAPLLALAFRYGPTATAYGAILLALYGLGHAATIALAGASASLVQRYLRWTDRSGAGVRFRQVAGAMVIAAGVYFLWTA
jgi:cytochrome c-type biogenesis protein